MCSVRVWSIQQNYQKKSFTFASSSFANTSFMSNRHQTNLWPGTCNQYKQRYLESVNFILLFTNLLLHLLLFKPVYLLLQLFAYTNLKTISSANLPQVSVKPFKLALSATVVHVRLETPNVTKSNGSPTSTVFLASTIPNKHPAPSLIYPSFLNVARRVS